MALTPEDVVEKRFQPTKFREGYDQDEVDDFLDEIVVEMRSLYKERDELRKRVAELEGQLDGKPASSGKASDVAQASESAPVAEAEAEKKSEESEPTKEDVKASEPAAASSTESAATATAPQQSAPVAAQPGVPTGTTPSAESAAGVLAMAQQLHDQHVAEGIAQRDRIVAEAQMEASSLVSDAEEKSRKTLGALEEQRTALERKVEQLRSFERDYRSRLKSYIEGQLQDLENRSSVAAPDSSEKNRGN